MVKRRKASNHKVDPECWKTLVAMTYFLFATWVTAIVMVIVHDRVPDMQIFPPLPGKTNYYYNTRLEPK